MLFILPHLSSTILHRDETAAPPAESGNSFEGKAARRFPPHRVDIGSIVRAQRGERQRGRAGQQHVMRLRGFILSAIQRGMLTTVTPLMHARANSTKWA